MNLAIVKKVLHSFKFFAPSLVGQAISPALVIFFWTSTVLSGQCTCGANPPGPPANRELHPYASAPEDMRPFSKFTVPYYENYTKQVEYNGAAREIRTLKAEDVDEVRIGFLGPVENHPDERLGKMMLNGAMLAIEEANARGGYCGKPFKLMVHNDQAVWGASSNEIVKMVYDDKVWAMLGSISGDSTHIALRVSLKAELPIVNSAATDPTIPETIIPWYFTTLQDDRVQGYTLARRIYTDLGLKRIALLRINDRYGRFGVLKFKDASRRLGHPVFIEQKYMQGATDFSRQLRIINESGADGIVIWGDAAPAGMILKQMREMGLKQRVFGSFRVLGDDLFQIAGDAADGLEVVFPFDPSRDDPAWLAFKSRFDARYSKLPDVFASLSYDTMNVLLQAICRGGLNRGHIRDALAGLESYKGVTGDMVFDPNSKNIVPMYLAAIHNGKAEFRRYPMEKPYAQVSSAEYNGPEVPDSQPRIALFGPRADKLAAELQPLAAHFTLIGVDSGVPWGKASDELVRLIYDQQVLAILATDRNASHLAEQLAVKAFVPVVAVSSDHDLTAVNIPWLFRLAPDTPSRDALNKILSAAEKSGLNRARLRAVLAQL
ncbi:MAG TPA: ABC transporter substrate-binding protein [Bryobacteraceae bacterium]|nr:ABC transporter substrate-binding protein [Bryobacteraceae bacterium]